MKHYSQSIIVNLSICITSYLSNIQLYVNIFWYIDVFVYFIHLCFCDSFCSCTWHGGMNIQNQPVVAWNHFEQNNQSFTAKLDGHPYLGDDPIWRAYFSDGLKPSTRKRLTAFATTILEIDVRLKLFDMNSTCRSRRLRSIRSLFKRGLDSFWFDIMELTAQLSLKSKKMTLPASC